MNRSLVQPAGALALTLLAVGACQIYVVSPAPRPTPTPPPPVAPAPRPQAVAAPAPQTQRVAFSVARPRPAVRFAARVVRPPPMQNAGAPRLNVQALKLGPHKGRRCGAREVPPGSGHWIHLDCNPDVALTTAKPFSARKIRLMLAGKLKLDSPIGPLGVGPAAAQSAELDRAVFSVLPESVDHRKDGTEGPIEDQGQVGACTAFSLASAMDNAIRRQNKGDVVSPMHIWSHYGFPVIKTAGDDNINKPIATWDGWPYDERLACELDQSGDSDCGPYVPPVIPGSGRADPHVQAKLKEADSKGRWKVVEYDEITPDPDTLAAVLASGADVWATMNVGSTWLSPQGDSVADWNETQIEGGHAVLFAGYRNKSIQRQFLVHNSWGKGWADEGFGYISEAMVRQFTKHAYQVVVADSAQPAAPADDPSALTDDDCGEDQLVDAVTGQCAVICPDDTRPSNGTCAAPPPHALHVQTKP